MKQQILSFLLSISVLGGVFAQATKYPLVEHFTNTRCPSCGSNNPGFYQKILPYRNKKVHHIAYHPSYPYSSCVLYKANPSENDARYNASGASNYGTPTYTLNGGTPNSVTAITDAALKTEIAKTSPLQIDVKEIAAVNGWTANIKLKAKGSLNALNYVLMVALCEKTLDYNAPNGEKVHYDVFRKMLTSVTGNPIAVKPIVGTDVEYNLNYTLDASWNANEMYVLAWVVDPATKEVINSGSKFTTVVGTQDIVNDENITIYPNPTTEQLNIDLSKSEYQIKDILVYDAIGKVVLQNSNIQPQTLNTINVTTLPKGNYVLKMQTNNNEAIVRSFIKQ